MQDLGKGIGTIGVWLGIVALTFILQYGNHLGGWGVALIVTVGVVLTMHIWNPRYAKQMRKTMEEEERERESSRTDI